MHTDALMRAFFRLPRAQRRRPVYHAAASLLSAVRCGSCADGALRSNAAAAPIVAPPTYRRNVGATAPATSASIEMTEFPRPRTAEQ